MTTTDIVLCIITITLIILWIVVFIKINKKYYWQVKDILNDETPLEFKPKRRLKRALKAINKNHDIVVKYMNLYYMFSSKKELKREDMVLLMNGDGEIRMTKCLTCDKLGTFPPIFADNTTLVEYDLVGVLVKVAKTDKNLLIVEDFNMIKISITPGSDRGVMAFL